MLNSIQNNYYITRNNLKNVYYQNKMFILIVEKKGYI